MYQRAKAGGWNPSLERIKKSPTMLLIELSAEREGFKPPERTSRSPDFESGPIGHSGISPDDAYLSIADAKVCKSCDFSYVCACFFLRRRRFFMIF